MTERSPRMICASYCRDRFADQWLKGRCSNMLLMIAGVILVLWLLGLIAIPASGGLINILLIVAIVVIVAHFLGMGRSSARV